MGSLFGPSRDLNRFIEYPPTPLQLHHPVVEKLRHRQLINHQ